MKRHVWTIALVALVATTSALAQGEAGAADGLDADAAAVDPIDPDEVEPITAPPAPVVAAPASEGAPVDVAAEDSYRGCTALLAGGHEPEARACFLRVVVQARGSEAALKAEVALFVLDARIKSSSATGAVTDDELNLIPPGRLGITTAAGLFGAWNAIGAGVMIAASTNGAIAPQGLIIGTSAAAIVGGVAMGAGGYFLAEHLQLDEGAARLVASSLVWGTAIGLALAPTVGSAFAQNGALATDVAVLTVLGSGYLAAGGAVLLVGNLEFDEAQVGLINSGGMIGSFLGLLAMPHVAKVGASSTVPYSITYVGATSLGLLGGAVLGRTLDMTWGEVLLCDLGAVLGGIGGGGLALGIGSSNAFALTLPPAIGVVGGYGAGLLIVSQWRNARGAPVLREAPALRPMASAAYDGNSVVPTFGFAGSL